MNDSIYRISLDIHEHGSQAALKAKKTDTGRKLHISLRAGGTSYIIADDCYAVFKATKPDGSILYNACTIENNEIIYEFTEQTCTAVGRSSCEIALYGLDDKLITSPRFTLLVDGTVYPDGRVESTDEFSALTQMVSDTMEAKNAASEAASAANTAAKNANKAAEAAKPGASIIPVDAAKLDYLKAEHSLVLDNSYLITETDEQGIVMGYKKGDIFLATDKGSFEWQMNINGKSIIPVEGQAFEQMRDQGKVVPGNQYLIFSDSQQHNKGDIVKATSEYDYDFLMNIIGEPGKSAYDVAVEYGFKGQEQEWLDSLKGKDGKDGTPIIPIAGDALDLLVSDASNGESALVIGTLYLTTSDTNENGNAFVNAPAGTLFSVMGVDTVEEQVRLKGEPGKDYVLTDADKEKITQSVLAALPSAEGASF